MIKMKNVISCFPSLLCNQKCSNEMEPTLVLLPGSLLFLHPRVLSHIGRVEAMLLASGAGRRPMHLGLGRNFQLAQGLHRGLHGVDGRDAVESLVDVRQGCHELSH